MRKDSSASLASDATESSPLQPKNLFGTPPSEGMKQATLKRFFSPGDEKMEDFSDREPPLKKSMRMMDTIKALIASGQCQIDGKTVELTEKNANQVKAAVAKDRGGRPRKLITKRGVAGGLKSNVRLKHQKRLKDEVPISRKHEICVRMQESRDGFATSDEFFAHWSKQFRMKKSVLRKMYAKKASYKEVVDKHHQSMSHQSRTGRGAKKGHWGPGTTRHERFRAPGGGAKKELPLVYERLVAWFRDERLHGHTVLKRHLSWKYHEFVKDEIARLRDQMDQAQTEKDMRSLKNQLDKAKKQDQTLAKSSKNMEKRANQLLKWMGAKIRTPNLETQLGSVEQQVRAEISWQYFDWQLHRMMSTDESQLKLLFSKPLEAMRSMKQAVIRCSDQVPIWIKKPSAKEVFGGWEIRVSGRRIDAVRQNVGEQLSKKAQKKGIKNVEEKDEPVEQKDAQIVEHQPEEGEEDEAWQLANPLKKEEGHDHTTTMREANCDKYRITFEAHQMITGFFDPDATPSGQCMFMQFLRRISN